MGSQRVLINWLKCLDLFVAGICFFILAVTSIPDLELVSVGQFLSLRFSVGNALLVILMLGAWHLSLTTAGVYEGLPIYFGQGELIAVAKGTTFGIALWLLAGVTLSISFVTATFLLQVWLAIVSSMIAVRLLTRSILNRRGRREQFRRNLLIVGVNPRSLRIARELERGRDFARRIVGFADDSSMGGFPLVSTLVELPDFLRKTAIDEVIVCLPIKSQFDRMVEIINCCEDQGIMVRVMADILAGSTSHSSIDQVGDNALVSLHPHGINGSGASVKRLIDIIGAGLLITALTPVLAVAAAVVTLSSSGPAFFTQDRVGRNKKIFKMIKFRTMVADASARQSELEDQNEASGPVFKIENDPRITRVGRFLRRTSIDELPQLINVLRGEMSLVGPRPLPVRDYERFSEDWHRRRFSVRPGISGLWQVAGRSNLPFDEWMELDLKYINEWSLTLDFKVLLRTLPAVLKGTGAT
jgi:exopolysaccharide biosynthesis polyprenyl glycosylphosphotransferase